MGGGWSTGLSFCVWIVLRSIGHVSDWMSSLLSCRDVCYRIVTWGGETKRIGLVTHLSRFMSFLHDDVVSATMMLVCLVGWSLVCGCLRNTSCAGDISFSAIDYVVLPVI